MYVLYIGGQIVQYGDSISKLTLIRKDLMEIVPYHIWQINNTVLSNTYNDNKVNYDKIKVIEYFDGFKNNTLQIFGGMAAPKYKVIIYSLI